MEDALGDTQSRETKEQDEDTAIPYNTHKSSKN